ncbi:hypothetical protein U1Q18_006503, partial [Sarracenia purpurea var. burkii]
MARKSPTSALIILILFAIALSPMQESEAARSTHRVVVERAPICPACVCCEPPPAGSCCR